ncbi:MAG: ABC transporter ATP-binding protein [Candidatus Rokubacteria bacterium RIFCSPLOWO2_12_FULL_71_22]|nr:MAG: ABC transporter ATP-binding protein [Candidatus Rokubacteria bacterium RIFCSPLOWO2_12_FULL_71_22]
MLEVRDLSVAYGDVRVVHGVGLRVGEGEIVSLVGANGAGKTTTLRAISGLMPALEGQVLFEGRSLAGLGPSHIVELGVAHVPEGRQLFTNMTVEENLEMGAYLPRARAALDAGVRRVTALFPRLGERRQQVAGTLSGGEQQMLAIGRALMSRPRLLILDEPSLGLAPLLVKAIFEAVQRINAEGTTVLLVEQNLAQSLRLSHRGYVLETGRIVLEGTAEALLENPHTRRAFLGLS